MSAGPRVEYRDQELILNVVNQVADLLRGEGFLPRDTLVVEYQYPSPFWKYPPGRFAPPTETGFALVDSRDATGRGESGGVEYLATIDHFNRGIKPDGPTQFQHRAFFIWLDPAKVSAEKAAQIRRSLVSQ